MGLRHHLQKMLVPDPALTTTGWMGRPHRGHLPAAALVHGSPARPGREREREREGKGIRVRKEKRWSMVRSKSEKGKNRTFGRVGGRHASWNSTVANSTRWTTLAFMTTRPTPLDGGGPAKADSDLERPTLLVTCSRRASPRNLGLLQH